MSAAVPAIQGLPEEAWGSFSADSRTAAARHNDVKAIAAALHFVVSVLVSVRLAIGGEKGRG